MPSGMHRAAKTATRALAWLVGIPIGLLVISSLLLGWPLQPWLNDMATRSFLRALESIELPPGSVRVASASRFGLLWCCSNHCDWDVAVAVASPLDPAAFQAAFRPPDRLETPTGTDEDPLLEIFHSSDGSLALLTETGPHRIVRDGYTYFAEDPPYDFMLDTGDFDFLTTLAAGARPASQQDLYLIRATDQAYTGSPMRDFRCH